MRESGKVVLYRAFRLRVTRHCAHYTYQNIIVIFFFHHERQTWVAQILHESCKNFDDKMVLSYESLVDGRVLCQVVNGIAPGSVESIHQDDSSESNVSGVYNIASNQSSDSVVSPVVPSVDASCFCGYLMVVWPETFM